MRGDHRVAVFEGPFFSISFESRFSLLILMFSFHLSDQSPVAAADLNYQDPEQLPTV